MAINLSNVSDWNILPSYGDVPSARAVADAASGGRSTSTAGFALFGVGDTEAIDTLGVAPVDNWVYGALHRAPRGITNFVQGTNIVVWATNGYNNAVVRSFIDVNAGAIVMAVDDGTTEEQLVGVLGHELWHAFSTTTGFWESADAQDLLDLFETNNKIQPEEISREIGRRWSGMSLSSVRAHDERMGDALASVMLGYPYERILDEIIGWDAQDITMPFMGEYLMSRQAWDSTEKANDYRESIDRFGEEFSSVVSDIKNYPMSLDSESVRKRIMPYYDERKQKTPALYRGIADKNNLQVGDTYSSTGFDSWDTGMDTPVNMALINWDETEGTTPTILHLDEGDEGLWIDRVNTGEDFDEENEWILNGDFEVTEDLGESTPHFAPHVYRNLKVRRKKAWNSLERSKSYEDAISRFGEDFLDARWDWKNEGDEQELRRYYDQHKLKSPQPLYRGIMVDKRPEVGDIYSSSGLDSWTEDEILANEFANNNANKFNKPNGFPIVIQNNEAEGLPIDRYDSNDDMFGHEYEWVMDGDYEYVSAPEGGTGYYEVRRKRAYLNLQDKDDWGSPERAAEVEDTYLRLYKMVMSRLPYRIYKEVNDVSVVVYSGDTRRQRFDEDVLGQYVPGGYGGERIEIIQDTQDNYFDEVEIVHTLTHELWHAYTGRTKFWRSDEGLKLAEDIGALDEWSGSADEIKKSMDDRWGEGYFGRSTFSYDEYDERMADALSLIVLDRNDREFREELSTYVTGMMESHILNKMAAPFDVIENEEYEDGASSRSVDWNKGEGRVTYDHYPNGGIHASWLEVAEPGKGKGHEMLTEWEQYVKGEHPDAYQVQLEAKPHLRKFYGEHGYDINHDEWFPNEYDGLSPTEPDEAYDEMGDVYIPMVKYFSRSAALAGWEATHKMASSANPPTGAWDRIKGVADYSSTAGAWYRNGVWEWLNSDEQHFSQVPYEGLSDSPLDWVYEMFLDGWVRVRLWRYPVMVAIEGRTTKRIVEDILFDLYLSGVITKDTGVTTDNFYGLASSGVPLDGTVSEILGLDDYAKAASVEEDRVYDMARKSPSERGYDRRWREFSEGYRAENPMCQGDGCENPARAVHHVNGWTTDEERYDTNNVVGLCPSCHNREHKSGVPVGQKHYMQRQWRPDGSSQKVASSGSRTVQKFSVGGEPVGSLVDAVLAIDGSPFGKRAASGTRKRVAVDIDSTIYNDLEMVSDITGMDIEKKNGDWEIAFGEDFDDIQRQILKPELIQAIADTEYAMWQTIDDVLMLIDMGYEIQIVTSRGATPMFGMLTDEVLEATDAYIAEVGLDSVKVVSTTDKAGYMNEEGGFIALIDDNPTYGEPAEQSGYAWIKPEINWNENTIEDEFAKVANAPFTNGLVASGTGKNARLVAWRNMMSREIYSVTDQWGDHDNLARWLTEAGIADAWAANKSRDDVLYDMTVSGWTRLGLLPLGNGTNAIYVDGGEAIPRQRELAWDIIDEVGGTGVVSNVIMFCRFNGEMVDEPIKEFIANS